MPIQDDRYQQKKPDGSIIDGKIDPLGRLDDLFDANLLNNPYHWLELAAEDIHKATIPPPEREEPFIDLNRPSSEYEQEYSDLLFTQEERKKRTEENLANRADRIMSFKYDETTAELVKNTPGLANRIKSFIADFRENGPPDICQNPAVQTFLTKIEQSLAV